MQITVNMSKGSSGHPLIPTFIQRWLEHRRKRLINEYRMLDDSIRRCEMENADCRERMVRPGVTSGYVVALSRAIRENHETIDYLLRQKNYIAEKLGWN